MTDLNAGARPFVPSSSMEPQVKRLFSIPVAGAFHLYGLQDYELDEERALAAIDDEIDRLNLESAVEDITEDTEEVPAAHDMAAAGAMPVGANGALSPKAAEFWFPECRDCTCCKGFKYGCDCRAKGASQCEDPSCARGAKLSSPQAATTSLQKSDEYLKDTGLPSENFGEEVYIDQEGVDESVYVEEGEEYLSQEDEDALAEVEAAMMSEESQEEPPRYEKPTTSYIPAGAMPVGANGALSPQAAEFWFPECRDCTCCKGFKYGCDCRARGAPLCEHPSCSAIIGGNPSRAQQEPARRGSSSTEAAPCIYFKIGTCKFGDSCRFLHVKDASAPPPSPVMCKFDTRCAYRGQGCPYRHTACNFFFKSKCEAGSECIYSHEMADMPLS